MTDASGSRGARAATRLAGVTRRAATGAAAGRIGRRVAPILRETLGATVVSRPELDASIAGATNRLDDRVARLEQEHAERLRRIEPIVGELVEVVRWLRREIDSSDRRAEVDRAARRLDELQASLLATPYTAGDPFERFAAEPGAVWGFRSPPASGDPASAYAGFEDVFRGPAARVLDTQRPYLPLVAAHPPVLDLGCGRGEFLGLLRDAGVEAHGVDSDPGMVARARAAGFAVTEADANDYLAGLEDGSVGTIFSAQVIEHVPVDALQRMLSLARRKLAPDGLLVAETVNPHSLAALKTFWVDLTHQHPIFPEVALALCGLAGFGSAYVFAPGYDDFDAARFSSNSYAVVASPSTEPG